MSIAFTKNIKHYSDSGFTLVEAVVVIFILGILTAISGPPILAFISSSRVDEAKSILNTAAAQCIRLKRTNPDTYLQTTPDILKERTLPTGYAFEDNKNTCDQTTIYDPTGDKTTRLLKLSFSIIGDKVIKEAEYYHPDTEAACKSWGNCGGSPEAQAIKQCLTLQTTCEKNLNAQVSSGYKGGPILGWTGTCSYPPDQRAGCSRETWAFKGTTYNDKKAYEDAVAAALGVVCNAKLKAASANDGRFSDTECGIDTWFYQGTEVNTEAAYSAAILKAKQDQCAADKLAALNSGSTYNPFTSACGDVTYICKGIQYGTPEIFKQSPCGVTCSTEQYVSGYQNQVTQIRCGMRMCTTTISVPIYASRQVCK